MHGPDPPSGRLDEVRDGPLHIVVRVEADPDARHGVDDAHQLLGRVAQAGARKVLDAEFHAARVGNGLQCADRRDGVFEPPLAQAVGNRLRTGVQHQPLRRIEFAAPTDHLRLNRHVRRPQRVVRDRNVERPREGQMHRPDPHAGTVEALLHPEHPGELLLFGNTPIALVHGDLNPRDTVGAGLTQFFDRRNRTPHGGGGPDLGPLGRRRDLHTEQEERQKNCKPYHGYFRELLPCAFPPRMGQPDVAAGCGSPMAPNSPFLP